MISGNGMGGYLRYKLVDRSRGWRVRASAAAGETFEVEWRMSSGVPICVFKPHEPRFRKA